MYFCRIQFNIVSIIRLIDILISYFLKFRTKFLKFITDNRILIKTFTKFIPEYIINETKFKNFIDGILNEQFNNIQDIIGIS